jgi:hypothetical protein
VGTLECREHSSGGRAPVQGTGYLDHERVWLANIAIGSLWWTGLFGDPLALFYIAPGTRFPGQKELSEKG